jgi:F0F1-type ATP synthase assembly protein I
MKLIYTPREQWELIKPIWRVLLLAFVVQLCGGIAGVLMMKFGHPFIDFWYGGAMATFPGFILGALWSHFADAQSLKSNIFAIAFVGAICISLTIAAFLMPLEEMASQIRAGAG